ncbi:DUF2628 domain-containing protein [Shewanella algae]|uniref:DUF2628 domain-containing protein n=1 Tax=Shewanella algae TaxID=38313 RepID=UPI0011821591|nr:DUF2628 domain-containing protein [Shewanella algae]
MTSFNLIFKGEIQEGKDRHKLSLALAKFLNVPESKAHLLFSGNPISIKKGLTATQAETMKAKLLSAGIITHLKQVPAPVNTAQINLPKSEPKPVVKPATKQSSEPTMAPVASAVTYDGLNARWQRIFAEFDFRQADKLGYFASAKSQPHLSRSKKEQIKGQNVINFNVLAFIFGPFYYITKGMWKKGLYLFLLTLGLNLLSLVLVSLFTDRDISKVMYIINSTIYGLTANYDYYRYYKLGETTWDWMPKWMASGVGTVSLVVGSLFGVVLLAYSELAADNVSIVQDGYMNGYKQTTIGQAFDGWQACSKTSWREQQASNGAISVIYQCSMNAEQVKNLGKQSLVFVTGQMDDTFLAQVDAAVLAVSFQINIDDTFEINGAQWALKYGEGKAYSPFVNPSYVLKDIYANRLKDSVADAFTLDNLVINHMPHKIN